MISQIVSNFPVEPKLANDIICYHSLFIISLHTVLSTWVLWSSIFLKATISLVGNALYPDINNIPLFWVGGEILLKRVAYKFSVPLFLAPVRSRTSSAYHRVSFPLSGMWCPLTSCCQKPLTSCQLPVLTHPSCSLLKRTHLGKAFRMLGHFFHVIKSNQGVMMCSFV